jgi:hypothetical protein
MVTLYIIVIVRIQNNISRLLRCAVVVERRCCLLLSYTSIVVCSVIRVISNEKMRDNASICILYADNIHNTITYAVWYVRTCIPYPISILCFIRFNIII